MPVVVAPGPNDSIQPLTPGDWPEGGIDDFGLLPTIERCWYVDPKGGITDLTTDMDTRFKEGIEGRFMAPIQHQSDAVPEQDGARYRGTRSLPRALSIPLVFVAEDTVRARGMLRSLSRGLNPKKKLNGLPAQGRLFVVTEDGLRRYINCLYEQGLESNTEPTTSQATFLYTGVRSVTPVFRAFDPYWYDVDLIEVPVEQTTSTATFFPAPPWRLGPSTVYAAWTQRNDGDVEAWPVWEINGPGEGIRLINDTTSYELSLDFTVGVGQTLVVDTRPGYKTVTLQPSGTNLFPYLSGDLWSLDDDENDLRVEMINTTNDSAVTLRLQQRYQAT